MSKDLKVVKSINFRALQIYKEIFGDLRILPGYVLQTSSFKRVPAYFDCYKLGKHVSALREWYKTDKSVFEPEDLKRIDEMGFVWQLQDPKADLALLAFKVYSRLNRNCEVPLEYVVPKCDDWPQITWGLRLGEILHGIRSEGSYKSIHEGLRELGVNFNRKSSNKSRFDRIYDGLSAYKAVNGDLRVPRKFVVPQDSKEYPKHTWGIQLGYEMFGILKGRYSEHKDKLKKLGVRGINSDEEKETFERVLEALQAYKNEHGDLLVPDYYVAAPAAGTESSSGLPLGKIVKSIRKNGRFSQFRGRLEDIGFVFNDGLNKPIEEIA